MNDNVGKLDRALDKSERGDKIDQITADVDDNGVVTIKLLVSQPFVRPWQDAIKYDMELGTYAYVLTPLQENRVDGVWVNVIYQGDNLAKVKHGDELAKIWTT